MWMNLWKVEVMMMACLRGYPMKVTWKGAVITGPSIGEGVAATSRTMKRRMMRLRMAIKLTTILYTLIIRSFWISPLLTQGIKSSDLTAFNLIETHNTIMRRWAWIMRDFMRTINCLLGYKKLELHYRNSSKKKLKK
jgi:hypothetical protein